MGIPPQSSQGHESGLFAIELLPHSPYDFIAHFCHNSPMAGMLIWSIIGLHADRDLKDAGRAASGTSWRLLTSEQFLDDLVAQTRGIPCYLRQETDLKALVQAGIQELVELRLLNVVGSCVYAPTVLLIRRLQVFKGAIAAEAVRARDFPISDEQRRGAEARFCRLLINTPMKEAAS